jgi:hypothetical protein
MKKAVGLGCLLVLLGAFAGEAAELKELEAVMKEAISTLGETGNVLATITDKATADKARPELRKLRAKQQELLAKAQKLGKPTEAQEKELNKKYKKGFDAALTKMRAELVRLATEDYAQHALAELKPEKKKKSPTETPKKD